MRSRWVPGPFACGGPHKEASFQARCSPGACLRGAPPPPTSLPDPWPGSPERRRTSRVPVFLRGKPPARLGASPRLLLLRRRDRRLPILSAGTAAGRRETSRSPRPRPPGNLGCQPQSQRDRVARRGWALGPEGPSSSTRWMRVEAEIPSARPPSSPCSPMLGPGERISGAVCAGSGPASCLGSALPSREIARMLCDVVVGRGCRSTPTSGSQYA